MLVATLGRVPQGMGKGKLLGGFFSVFVMEEIAFQMPRTVSQPRRKLQACGVRTQVGDGANPHQEI